MNGSKTVLRSSLNSRDECQAKCREVRIKYHEDYRKRRYGTLIKEVHKIVKQSGVRRIIIANSATSIDENNKNDVVVVGSHFGRNVGEMAFNAKIRGMIGNDAGKGLDNSGIAGLKVLEEHDVPAAAVSCMSATIGDGMSTYEEGEISAANEAAGELGIAVGMSAKEAADKMFEGV